MKIKPIGNRILIKARKIEEKRASGIIIATETKELNNIGEVIEIGEKVTEIKKGDSVVYSKYNAEGIKQDGENYFIVNVDDILAIVEY